MDERPIEPHDLLRTALSADMQLQRAMTSRTAGEDSPRLTEVDRELVQDSATGPGADSYVLTRPMLADLARQAQARFDGFKRSPFVRAMGLAAANRVRQWRVDEQGSWRHVAQRAHEAWNGARDRSWDPPSNQLMGIALCQRAAQLLGEDPDAAPWN